jgi:SAM-dependent methyltransferase
MLTTMLRQDPIKHWEAFGRHDPYFGVCTKEQFRGAELGAEARKRFFASGDRQMDELLADARSLVDPDFHPETVLEYGCGVGRLLIPAAKHANRAVGVDVSPSMLAEARRNCEAFDASGVELLAPEELAEGPREFDFIYSIAVLQHVPRRVGERIVVMLMDLLRPGGVGAINLVLGAEPHLARFNAVMKVPFAHSVRNILHGQRWPYPYMQMNVYDLNRVTLLLRDRGVRRLQIKAGPKSEGFDPCTIFFSRQDLSPPTSAAPRRQVARGRRLL